MSVNRNDALHDFVDGAISGGARLATSSPANERKTFSVTSFFDKLCSTHTQIQFVQNFLVHTCWKWFAKWKGNKKRRRYIHKVSKEKARLSGSIYFDFKAQGRKENRRVVCFSPRKRTRWERNCRNARSPRFPESAKGQLRTRDDRIQIWQLFDSSGKYRSFML